MNLNDRVRKLEKSQEHLFGVLVTQRENVGKALSQVQVALLEQEMTLRSHFESTNEVLREFAARSDDHEERTPPAA